MMLHIHWHRYSPYRARTKRSRLHNCAPSLGLPRWLSGKESACQCRRRRFNSWVGKIPWRRKWQPTLVFLPGKSHGQRGHKSWTRLSNYTTTTTRHARMFSSTSWQRNWRAESHVFTVDPKVKWLVCVSHMITELLFFFNWVIINSYTIKFRSF